MKMASAAMVAFFVISSAMVVVACGGGEKETTPTASPAVSPAVTEEASPALPSPSPTLPTETRAELEALLKAAALDVDDLPSGFTLDEEHFDTNEEAAEGDPVDPQERLGDFNRWGRLLGYEVGYLKDVGLSALLGGTTSITAHVAIYGDADGARAFLTDRRAKLEDPEWIAKMLANVEGVDASLSIMSFADIGDETIAIEITGNPSSELVDKFVIQVVNLREDRAIGTVITGAATAASPIEELEGLARKLQERIEAALKSPPEPSERTPGPTRTPTPEATPTPVAGRSRSNPNPLGQTTVVPPGWEITVLDVNGDAWSVVLAENQFNDPPEEGYRMVLITVRATNAQTGEETDRISYGDFALVGSRNQVYQTFERSCGVTPNDLGAELFPGGTVEGTVCFQAGVDETNLILIAEPSWDTEDRRYFALE